MDGDDGSRRDGLPLRIRVAGSSMEPTMSDGDRVVSRAGGRAVSPGDVVVARRPDRPDLLVVKRVVRREPGGWWLEGDNPEASDDSRVFGPVPDRLVLARVVARMWPRPRRL